MMTTRECFRRICNFQKADYIPNFEMGVGAKTLAAWRQQGLPQGASLAEFFHLHCLEDFQFINYGPLPGVPDQTPWNGVLKSDGQTRFIRTPWGTESETVAGEDMAPGAHRLLKPGIAGRADWDRIRGMFAPHPRRYVDHWEENNWAQCLARWKNRDYPLALRAPSMIGGLKEMMGYETYCLMLYDDLDLVEEIMEAQTSLACQILPRLLREADFDVLHFWEDIAYRNGPILPPQIFEKIAPPRYRRLADLFHSFGGKIVSVDSDGDIRTLIPGWLKGGITNIWPLEPFASMDVALLRREYGQAFSMRGGFDKYAIAKGREAIDREFDRIAPVVQDGGYIPHCDHQIDNAPFENYCYYHERKKQLCGYA